MLYRLTLTLVALASIGLLLKSERMMLIVLFASVTEELMEELRSVNCCLMVWLISCGDDSNNNSWD